MKNITLSSPQTPTWFNPNDRRYYLGFYNARQEVVMSTDFRYDNKTLDQIKAIEGFKRGSYFIVIEDDCTDRAKLTVWSGEDWFIYQTLKVDNLQQI